MKVLVLTNRFPVVSETFVIRHIQGLLEGGIDVWVMALPGDIELINGRLREHLIDQGRFLRFEESGGGRFPSLIKRIWRIPRSWKSLKLLTLLMLDFLSLRRKLNAGRALSIAQVLARAPNFDLVHAQHGQSAFVAARLMDSGHLDGKLIATFHGTDLNRRRITSNKHTYKAVWRRAALCSVGSQHMANHFEQVGLDEQRGVVLPVGVDTELYAPPENRQFGLRTKLLTVGRLTEVKGTKYAIMAVAELIARGKQVELEIIGDGLLKQELQQLAKSLNVAERVHFCGALPAEQTRNRMAVANILLHPAIVDSVGAREGQGLVLAEAQAMSLPIIASNVGGIPESVIDGVTAILTPEKDVQAIVNAVEMIAENAELRSAMGRAGREHAVRYFDQSNITRRWLTIYEKIISQ